MTNPSSQKRPWEGGSSENGVKRKRELSPSGATKDWRDVHLKDRDDRGERDRDRRRRRDDDHYYSSSRRDRDRDYRDRDRSRRSRERRYHDDRRHSRTRSPATRESTPPAVVGAADDEKEEGEISPSAPTPPRRPSPRHRYDKLRDRSRSRSRDKHRDGRRPPRSPRSRTRSPRSAREFSHPPSKQESVPPVSKVVEAKDVTMKEPEQPNEPEETVPSQPKKTEEEILAERRAKRAAILAKYEGSKSFVDTAPGTPNSGSVPPLSATPATFTPSAAVKDALAKVSLHGEPGTPTVTTGTPQRGSASPPPPSASLASEQDFELAKDENGDADANSAGPAGPDQQINAADYDPSLDRREDERKRFGIENGTNGHEQRGNGHPPEVMDVDADEDDEDETEEEEDLDDMFAVAFDDTEEKPKKKKKKTNGKAKKPKATGDALAAAASLIVDSAADPEGYYQVVLGERIDNGRYQVFSSLGKGMFANVVRARVVKDEFGKDIGGDGSGEAPREVAIKIIRCQESMYKAGLKEAHILQKLRALDPEDKKHIVKLERTFEHRGHLCLVFENLSMNLREVVKRFGKDVGLNIRAVRAYAHQLFLALSLLRKANVMHADIKPDNILVNEQKTLLKLCDLGSASDASENEITPYLVSRFYRAPEIILGVPYDPALDIWSIGCTLYELYTGKILFPGRSNNQMLRLMMELKGRFNGKMIKKAKFGETYFDELGAFESVEPDRLTGAEVTKKIHISQKPARDLRARLMPSSVKMKDEEDKMLLNFVDLLDKCLMLDPARRITPREALSHPFIRG